MSLLKRIFGGAGSLAPRLDIRFGRYSDAYKQSTNYDAWDRALVKFEQEDYLDSYREFFEYLRDDQEDNVRYWDENGGVRFELFQGSKKIAGFGNYKKFKAEAKIAKTQKLNVLFMRRLIEKNFTLDYSRFALDPDDNITILFDTYTIDGSPYKLYYALKELATNADKLDDLLLDEFRMLQPVDTSHLDELPPEEKEVKYNYLKGEIKKTLQEFNHGRLSQEHYAGGLGFLLLHLVYKLDYLIKPEGFTMETLERIHRLFFAKDDKSLAQKNQLVARELQKLLERPKKDYFKEMYRVKSTFGITHPANHDRIIAFIDGELPNMSWYKDNGHERVALAIPGYIVGYCLFEYAAPKPDRDLFHLYFQIMEQPYFNELGLGLDFFDPATRQFNRRSIRRAIDRIVADNRAKYPKLNPAVHTLDYRSLSDFARSFLLMLRNLDMSRVD
jgi:hypothetical protein